MSEDEPIGRRHDDAWAGELAKFTGTEMKVAHRGPASKFLRTNRDAVLASVEDIPLELPPALHFDPRWGACE